MFLIRPHSTARKGRATGMPPLGARYFLLQTPNSRPSRMTRAAVVPRDGLPCGLVWKADKLFRPSSPLVLLRTRPCLPVTIPRSTQDRVDSWFAGLRGKETKMYRVLLLASALLGLTTVASAQQTSEAKLTSLLSRDLTGFKGKDAVMLMVEYPPGAVDPIHRHNAHAFVYVLEGTIVMQVKGGQSVTLNPGQTFYEGPDDVHVVGRNASTTAPARFVVFFVKDKGAPILIPVP